MSHQCQCDYDCQDDPPRYVRTNRTGCTLHNSCTSCGTEGDSSQTQYGWLCPTCLEVAQWAHTLANEYWNGASLESMSKTEQHECWDEAIAHVEMERAYTNSASNEAEEGL